MQCSGALRRPLRNIVQSIAHASLQPAHSPTHINAIARTCAASTAAPTCSYSLPSSTAATAAAPAPDTRQPEQRIATAEATSSADRSSQHQLQLQLQLQHHAQPQGLRILKTTHQIRPIVLGEARDHDLEFKSQVCVENTSPGHGPARRVLSGKDASEATTQPEEPAQPANATASANASSYFEDMLAAVTESRPRDGPDYTEHRPYFGPRYFDRQQRERRARKERHERKIQLHAERHPSLANDAWHTILKLLEAHTPAGPELYKQKVVTLTLPEGFVADFHRDVSLAVLEIRQRTGSHLQLLDASSRRTMVDGIPKFTFAALALSGSADENEAALHLLPEYVYVYSERDLSASRDLNDYDLQRREGSVAEGALHHSPEQTSSASHTTHSESDDELSVSELGMLNDAVKSATCTSPVRSVWSVGRWFTDYSRHQLGMPPTTRSTASMTRYIFDITMRTPRQAARKHNGNDQQEMHTHVERVVEELVSLCTDPAAPSWLSAEALDKALYYLLNHNNLRAFRIVRRALEAGGEYRFSASNYAVLLDAAARSGDVHNFLILTRVMLNRELPVTAQIWKHFRKLVTVRNIPEAFGPMIKAMRTKGLLANTKLAQVVSADLALERLNADLQAGTPFNILWAKCDARIATILPAGFDWFNVHTANRMIQVLLQWGQLENAYAVLERIRERRAPIPTSTLNLFLTSALHNRDPATAVSILQRFKIGLKGAIIPDRITYHELFNIAWLRRYYNMLRVIWRYACAAGHVNYSMRSRLRSSLCSAIPPGDIDSGDISRGQLWKMLAGKFAVGVSRGLKIGPRVNDVGMLKSEHHLLQLTSPRMVEAGSEEEKARYAALLELMQDDLNEVNNCKPTEPLSKMLAEAYATDIAWRSESHIGLPETLSVYREPYDMFVGMMRRGIKVHMRAGNLARSAREWEAPGAVALWKQQR